MSISDYTILISDRGTINNKIEKYLLNGWIPAKSTVPVFGTLTLAQVFIKDTALSISDYQIIIASRGDIADRVRESILLGYIPYGDICIIPETFIILQAMVKDLVGPGGATYSPSLDFSNPNNSQYL